MPGLRVPRHWCGHHCVITNLVITDLVIVLTNLVITDLVIVITNLAITDLVIVITNLVITNLVITPPIGALRSSLALWYRGYP